MSSDSHTVRSVEEAVQQDWTACWERLDQLLKVVGVMNIKPPTRPSDALLSYMKSLLEGTTTFSPPPSTVYAAPSVSAGAFIVSFDGTVGSLVSNYQNDPRSAFQGVSLKVRANYTVMLKRVVADIGTVRIPV